MKHIKCLIFMDAVSGGYLLDLTAYSIQYPIYIVHSAIWGWAHS